MKLLIVYYSYSGITRRLAEDIAFVKTVFLLNIANTIAPIKTTTKPTEPMIIDFLDNFKDFITKNQLLFCCQDTETSSACISATSSKL